MRTTGMTIHARLRETVTPDNIFRTRYVHQTAHGFYVAVCNRRVPAITLPRPETGDELAVTVPSGTLTGTVLAILEEGPPGQRQPVYCMWAAWEGSYGGLMGGMSGVMDWELADYSGTVVESSAIKAPVPLADYIAAQLDTSRNPSYDPSDPDAVAQEEYVKELHQRMACKLGIDLQDNYARVHREVLRERILKDAEAVAFAASIQGKE